MSQIDEVRNKTDIVEIIGASGVNLRKTGRSFVGFCPFHPNSRTPAFTVYPDSQSFYCFGCHASGTVFDYMMRKQGMDFREALEQLAQRAGVRLEPKGEQERQEDARRTRLLEINAAAAKYFNYILVSMKRGQPARDYVEKRELNSEIIETFQLGYSLEEWQHLFSYLTDRKGYTPDEVEAAGLAVRSEQRGHYDRFRGRLIFPIRDTKGQVVGFGGRALGDGQPKYLNSPETLLFKKGELLYGLDLAREAIRNEDRTVVVEGYIDVITAHQHGFRNVVAPLGTALTKGHVGLLKRLSHHVFLALDADAAGQKATLRGLNTLRESSEDTGEGHLVTTAQGAVRLESDVNLRIIRMPEGRDPDEVIKEDPEHWRELITNAVPVMEFYISIYTSGLDLNDPQSQRGALDKLLPLLAELDGTQQRVYIARIEQAIGLKAELILDLLRGNRGAKKPRTNEGKGKGFDPAKLRERNQGHPEVLPSAPAEPAQGNAARPVQRNTEDYLLALALRYPSVAAAIEALLEKELENHTQVRELFGGGLEDLLENPANQLLWRVYNELPFDERPTSTTELSEWASQLDESLRSQASQLIGVTVLRPEDYRYRQEAEQCARNLRIDQVKQLQRRLLQRITEPDPEGEQAEQSNELEQQLNNITKFLASLTAPRRSSTFPDMRNSLGRE